MVEKKNLYLLGFLLLFSILIQNGQVKSHNPSSMILEYDKEAEILGVTITHDSENFTTHYIFELIGIINHNLVINESFTSQQSNTFKINYYLPVVVLDVLTYTIEFTARCTQGGIITETLLVDVFPPSKGIPGFLGFLLLFGVSTIALISKKLKKLKK